MSSRGATQFALRYSAPGRAGPGETDPLPLVARLQLGEDYCMEKDETVVGVATEVHRPTAAPGAREEVLQIAPRIYREYAKNFRELARTSESEPQRDIYLKAAQMWLDAATRFEFETGHFNSGRGQSQ